jgi:DNA-binding NarL/FixJ family response regulator
MTSQQFPPSKARILIVDDHPMVREGLAMHISTQDDMEVCGEAEDTASALKAMETSRPDLVIVDISLKNSNGLDLIRRIRDRFDDMRILIWSMYPEKHYAERALRAGARGYLNKTRATRELMEAIRSVLTGKVYVSGEFTEDMLEQFAAGNTSGNSPMQYLSDRELQAFELMGHGMATDVIAARMHVSSKTIETYRIRIKQKLGLKNATEVVQRATQWVLEMNSGGSPMANDNQTHDLEGQ